MLTECDENSRNGNGSGNKRKCAVSSSTFTIVEVIINDSTPSSLS